MPFVSAGKGARGSLRGRRCAGSRSRRRPVGAVRRLLEPGTWFRGVSTTSRARSSLVRQCGADGIGGGDCSDCRLGAACSHSRWRRCSSRPWSRSTPPGWSRRARCAGPSPVCSRARRQCCCSRGSVRADRVTGSVWLVLLTLLFVASVVGADALHAWIGTPDRRLGWIAWCTFPLMFLCGQALSTGRDRRTVMRGAAVAARAARSVVRRRARRMVAHRRVVRRAPRRRAVRAARIRRRGGRVCSHRWRRESRSTGADRARGVPSGHCGALGGGAALLLAQTRGAWIGVVVALVLLGARNPSVVRRRWREGAGRRSGTSCCCSY